MKQRVLVGLAVVVLALVGVSSAFAFDCIRVASSLNGLQQSTKSGNWLLFDLSTPEAFQESLTEFGVVLTDEQAACGSEAYAESGQPLFVRSPARLGRVPELPRLECRTSLRLLRGRG
jgi:hypothetical protein